MFSCFVCRTRTAMSSEVFIERDESAKTHDTRCTQLFLRAAQALLFLWACHAFTDRQARLFSTGEKSETGVIKSTFCARSEHRAAAGMLIQGGCRAPDLRPVLIRMFTPPTTEFVSPLSRICSASFVRWVRSCQSPSPSHRCKAECIILGPKRVRKKEKRI